MRKKKYRKRPWHL